MDRQSFLRDMAGAIAAIAIGSKLKLLETPVEYPGIGMQSFELTIPHGFFRQFDILCWKSGQFMIHERDGLMLARAIDSDLEIVLLQSNSVTPTPGVFKMMAAPPENDLT